MVLAAGLGTRLGRITRERPKALLEVGGITLLERTVMRLVEAGCRRVVINVHHHADQIEAELGAKAKHGEPAGAFLWHGAEILLSRELEAPLETGGGLKRAAPLFRPGHTILLHNADVISDLDLRAMAGDHEASGALATLAVMRREATRYLVFDADGLCGRIDTRTGLEEWAREPGAETRKVGFAGIHVVAPELPAAMKEDGRFSILQAYLRLARIPGRVRAHDATGCLWLDVGTPRRLAAARRHFDDPSR